MEGTRTDAVRPPGNWEQVVMDSRRKAVRAALTIADDSNDTVSSMREFEGVFEIKEVREGDKWEQELRN